MTAPLIHAKAKEVGLPYLISRLSKEERKWLDRNWALWARSEQLPPDGDWLTWLLLAGRGFGKTRTGAEWVRHEVRTGNRARLALVAPTAADARDVMVEGESGIMAIHDDRDRPTYEPSKRRLTWPNGAQATLYSADEPERLRGPQHDGAWCDEIASWRYPDAWDMLQFGMRIGSNPRQVVTTTPKPLKVIRDLLCGGGEHRWAEGVCLNCGRSIKDPGKPTVAITRGSTFDNRANLAETFFSQVVQRYEGTRLGRQELYAEVLDDIPGALWTRENLERNRRAASGLARIVVAVDPAATSTEGSDETGIIAAGRGRDGRFYVLEDASGRYTPDGWGTRVVRLAVQVEADCIVWESNQGGEMVRHVIRAAAQNLGVSIPDTPVRASRGKIARAEPIALLYEQNRASHVKPFPALEDQLTTWTQDQGESPDRLDALVWAGTHLMLKPTGWRPL